MQEIENFYFQRLKIARGNSKMDKGATIVHLSVYIEFRDLF